VLRAARDGGLNAAGALSTTRRCWRWRTAAGCS
jgi:hypothetical protein